jgi:uncharacterized Zn-binding protein involved in type VI secretion
MPAVQRNGDKNDDGGAIEGGVISVRVNGQRVSVDGTKVSDHTEHNATKTSSGTRSVRAGGSPINVKGNKDTCGHTRVGGSKDVFIGGR